MLILQQLINGLTIGSIYALLALGFTIVFGVLKLINFAHGEFFMMGAYLAMTALILGLVAANLPLPLLVIVVFLIGLAASSLVGVVTERLAYRPIGRDKKIPLLITSLGVSILLQNLAMVIWGKEYRVFPEIIPRQVLFLGDAVISTVQILIIVTSAVLMVACYTFVHHTRVGKAMRAIAVDPPTATLMGINVHHVIGIAFIIGPGLGGIAGVMVGLQYGLINHGMGFVAIVKAFTAAVLGGVGNIPGAMLGGLILGVLEAFGAGFISAEWKDVIAFVILIAVLLFRPSGLLGERVAEKL